MLAKKHRLNLSLEENVSIFRRENSSLVSSRFFLAYLRSNKKYLRVACLSPKAIFSKAADRNNYRRCLYFFLESEIEKNNFSLMQRVDLVIVIKRNFSISVSKDILSEDFSVLIKKINSCFNSN